MRSRYRARTLRAALERGRCGLESLLLVALIGVEVVLVEDNPEKRPLHPGVIEQLEVELAPGARTGNRQSARRAGFDRKVPGPVDRLLAFGELEYQRGAWDIAGLIPATGKRH